MFSRAVSGKRLLSVLALAVAGLSVASGADAKLCGKSAAGFQTWLQGFKGRAAAQGVSGSTLNSALSGIQYDRNVIRLDNSQHAFKLSFSQFYARRVSPAMIGQGRRKIRQYRAVLDRMEKRFGVPAEIVIAIWGLETSYGAIKGQSRSIVQSLATLSYDCRRPHFFEPQLVAALKIIDRGDMTASQLQGGWAGEIGQTQFLPLAYLNYAVDFDGNGRRDLVHSAPDVLASTANFLRAHGWVAGQDWHPGTKNYAVLGEWNAAEVYQRTIAVMADALR